MPRIAFAEFARAHEAADIGTPAGHRRLSQVVIEHPDAAALARLDPFSADYRAAVMALYLSLRGRSESGYVPGRDEALADAPGADIWTGLTPWSSRDASFVAEFLRCWAHMMALLDLPHGSTDSVLEYGPGSGQLLLMLARLGVRAHGADIDATVIANLRRQAVGMGLDVPCEVAAFGDGFEGARFDRIVFFEAFHHAIDFEALLRRLLERLNPGGRLILCGEPVLPAVTDVLPYPWGPRLDGLSVHCMREFGWMELGFTHGCLMEAFRRTGWAAAFHPVEGCARANAYVAVRQGETPPAPVGVGGVRRAVIGLLPGPVRRGLWRLRRAVGRG